MIEFDGPAPKLGVRIFGVASRGIEILSGISRRLPGGTENVAVGMNVIALADAGMTAVLPIDTPRGCFCSVSVDAAREAAIARASEIERLVQGTDLAIVVAKACEQAAAGIGPVVARICERSGALTVACVTIPPPTFGPRALRVAAAALDHLGKICDAVLTVPDLASIQDRPDLTLQGYWALEEELVLRTITALTAPIVRLGIGPICVDFPDLRAIFRRSGRASVLVGVAGGPCERAAAAVIQAVPPFRCERLASATGFWIVFEAASHADDAAIVEVAPRLSGLLGSSDVPLCCSVQYDPGLVDAVRVTILAAGVG